MSNFSDENQPSNASEDEFILRWKEELAPTDAPSEGHQKQLRVETLDTFDLARRNSESGAVVRGPSRTGFPATWVRTGLIASLAASVFWILALMREDGRNGIPPVIDMQPYDRTSRVYLASVAEVSGYRDEVTQQEYFEALAFCQSLTDVMRTPDR